MNLAVVMLGCEPAPISQPAHCDYAVQYSVSSGFWVTYCIWRGGMFRHQRMPSAPAKLGCRDVRTFYSYMEAALILNDLGVIPDAFVQTRGRAAFEDSMPPKAFGARRPTSSHLTSTRQ